MRYLNEMLLSNTTYVIYGGIALLIALILRFGALHRLRKLTEKTESAWARPLVDYLESLILPLLALVVLYVVAFLLPIEEKIIRGVQTGLKIAAIVMVAFFTARMILSVLKISANRNETLRRFIQPLRTLSNVMILLGAVTLVMHVLDVNFSQESTRITTIVGIIVGAYVLIRIIKLSIMQLERMVENADAATPSEAEKRAKTLGRIIYNAGFVLVTGVAIMMILSELRINIMPIITSAGIAGLAIGFGAQNLVRDIISGFFLILEDQIRVNDYVKINDTGGTIEAIKLRTTVLRDITGAVYIFPNGEIKKVANLTKQFSYSVIDLGVSYNAKVDDVMETLKTIGEELAADPEFNIYILDSLEVLGVDDFGDSQVTIRIRVKTKPSKQWVVGRELRRRIKNTFDAKGIEIPFPQVTLSFSKDVAANRPEIVVSEPFAAETQNTRKDPS